MIGSRSCLPQHPERVLGKQTDHLVDLGPTGALRQTLGRFYGDVQRSFCLLPTAGSGLPGVEGGLLGHLLEIRSEGQVGLLEALVVPDGNRFVHL